MNSKKESPSRRAKVEKRLYSYEFPREGAEWPMKKTGSVEAYSKAHARRILVKKGLLQPFEALVTEFLLVRP